VARLSCYERGILECLVGVQALSPDWIPMTVHMLEEYGIFRSFQGGSTLEARARGLATGSIRY
jgi:hypothetical protein